MRLKAWGVSQEAFVSGSTPVSCRRCQAPNEPKEAPDEAESLESGELGVVRGT